MAIRKPWEHCLAGLSLLGCVQISGEYVQHYHVVKFNKLLRAAR